MVCEQCYKILRRCNSDDMNRKCKDNFHLYHQLNTYCPSCARWVNDSIRPEHAEINHPSKTYCEECGKWESAKARHKEHTDERSRYNTADKIQPLNGMRTRTYDEHRRNLDHSENCIYCNPLGYMKNKNKVVPLNII
jgi:hypothetical protein